MVFDATGLSIREERFPLEDNIDRGNFGGTKFLRILRIRIY